MSLYVTVFIGQLIILMIIIGRPQHQPAPTPSIRVGWDSVILELATRDTVMMMTEQYILSCIITNCYISSVYIAVFSEKNQHIIQKDTIVRIHNTK